MPGGIDTAIRPIATAPGLHVAHRANPYGPVRVAPVLIARILMLQVASGHAYSPYA